MTHYDAKRLKVEARGRWLEIFSALSPSLHSAIDHLGRHVPCPVHGGKDGFRLFPNANVQGGGICNTCGAKNDGFSLLAWANGWDFASTVKAVGDYLGGKACRLEPSLQRPIREKETLSPEVIARRDAQSRQRMQSLFDQSKAITALESDIGLESALRYFAYRGLDIETLIDRLDPSVLRTIEAMPYWTENTTLDDVKCYPGLVCKVQDPSGQWVTLHRTYLSERGRKAMVDQPKKLMGLSHDQTINGAAIRLMPIDGDTLILCEGIETALSVAQGTGLPCWSVICANGLRSFQVPREFKHRLKRIAIFADNDRSQTGLLAAQVLAKRLRQEGFRSKIWMPSGPDTDWNDVLRNGEAIPTLTH